MGQRLDQWPHLGAVVLQRRGLGEAAAGLGLKGSTGGSGCQPEQVRNWEHGNLRIQYLMVSKNSGHGIKTHHAATSK